MLRQTDLPNEAEWESYFRAHQMLSKVGLRRGMVLADLGCGYGTFSIPAAKIVGKLGHVYGVDIDKKMTKRVLDRASKMKLRNITTATTSIVSSKRSSIPRKCADIALLANVIHGTKRRVHLLERIRPILAIGGSIVVINWKRKETPRGPPMNMRPGEKQMLNYLIKAGYQKAKILSISGYHYAAIASLAQS
ncbi:MAG TPA: methyltransferase domain-containing protein [Nitrososphaerales archaeon]|nr:methyltransferase domain-containing protein [Nitrososphaerales archaeon]